MPYRVIQIITRRTIKTPGPLTWEEATALAKHHNENQLAPDWKYEIEKYEENVQASEVSET